jgi:flagellin
MLQVADGALSQVTSLLNRAVTLATESSTGTVSDAQRQALQSEFAQIKAEIDRIGKNTTYNGSQVFAGGQTNFNQVVGAADDGAGMTTSVTGNVTVKVWDSTAGAYGNVQTFNATTTDATSGTVAGLIENINNSGSGLLATLDSTGNLMITDSQNRGSAAGSALADGGATTLKIGADAAAETMASTSTSSSMSIYLSDSTTAGSSSIAVNMGQFDSGNMNGISLSNDDLSTQGTAKTALTDINNAIAQVAALRGQLGASVNRLQSASNVISNQVQNLTSAENGIVAADIPTAVANMTKYSILEQTGISSLAQANQQQQLVLKLLQ